MKTKWFAIAFLVAVLGGGTLLHAQTASELLQKGIYMQETVGDLDAAMKLYSQVVQLAKDSRANAAQALYRLGVCQQKKGRQAEAVKTFQALIADYPDQTDVVAKARALVPAEAGLKLLPAPWSDGEVLDLQMKMANGQPVGGVRYSVQSSKTNPSHWLFENRTYTVGMQYLTRVEADKDTMKPVASKWTNMPLLRDTQITYQSGQARVEKAGKEPKIVPLDGSVWDNEESLAVMRRLPLAEGYKIPFSVVSPAGLVIKLGLSVTGVEDVQTAAGSFHCYRVELDIVNQKFWISTDSSRYLAKFDTNTVIAELRTIGRVGSPQAPATYQNEHGYSITLPAGWTVDSRDATRSKPNSQIQLLDPDSLELISIKVEPAKPDEIPDTAAMRAEADKHLSEAHDGSKLRLDSWQVRQVGGRPALAWLVDSLDPLTNQPKVEYDVQVRGLTTRAEITVMMDAKDLDSLRARLDPIFDTLTLK